MLSEYFEYFDHDILQLCQVHWLSVYLKHLKCWLRILNPCTIRYHVTLRNIWSHILENLLHLLGAYFALMSGIRDLVTELLVPSNLEFPLIALFCFKDNSPSNLHPTTCLIHIRDWIYTNWAFFYIHFTWSSLQNS